MQDPNVPWHLDLLDQNPTSYRDYQYSPTRTGKGVDAYILDTGTTYNNKSE